MSDDLRERQPLRDRDEQRANNPGEPGTRSDMGGTSATVPNRAAMNMGTPERPTEPMTGMATGASGGQGVGSGDGSSQGSGDGEPGRGATIDDQTDWLRSAPAPDATEVALHDATRDEGTATRGAGGLGAVGDYRE